MMNRERKERNFRSLLSRVMAGAGLVLLADPTVLAGQSEPKSPAETATVLESRDHAQSAESLTKEDQRKSRKPAESHRHSGSSSMIR
jgi:hypothetical protein